MNGGFSRAHILETEIFREDDLSGGMGHDLLTFGLLLYPGRIGRERYERYIRSGMGQLTLLAHPHRSSKCPGPVRERRAPLRWGDRLLHRQASSRWELRGLSPSEHRSCCESPLLLSCLREPFPWILLQQERRERQGIAVLVRPTIGKNPDLMSRQSSCPS